MNDKTGKLGNATVLCFYGAGMLPPYAPPKDIYPIFRIHFTETYHCVPAGDSIISQYIYICMNHIYSQYLHPHIHTDFTNKIQYLLLVMNFLLNVRLFE
jgi:hypothetical protein